MMSLNQMLTSLIKNKRNACCLCFHKTDVHNTEELVSIKDQVIVNINGKEETLSMSEILNSVLGMKTCDFVASFDILCDKCTRLTISSYTFMHTSRNNADLMIKMLNTVTNSVEATTENLYGSKTLYLSLNPEDFTSNQFYDCRKIMNCKEASRRFLEILNPTKPIKSEQKDIIIEKEHKRSPNFDIPLSKILFDENNPDILMCKECLKTYATICNLKSHYIRVHAPKKYKCIECPRKYGSKAYLNVHRRDSHSVFVCSECGKTFYNGNTFKEHELGHQTSIVCPDCGRTYKNKSTYKKHKENNVCEQQCRAHPSQAKFTCDYCGKKYTQKMSLRVHIQYEHGNYKSHVCEWCGKKYWAQSRLKAHIVKHTKEKNFGCTICGGKFVSKESLLYHTRIHTGEKPYKCKHCDASFISASRRSEHIKRHHVGVGLECNIKLTSKTYMLKHKKSHEEIKNEIQEQNMGPEVNIGSPICNEAAAIPTVSYEVYEDNNETETDNTYYLQVCDDSQEYIINFPKNEV